MDKFKFYEALRPKLGALSTANVVGANLILAEAGRRRTPLHDLAYSFATAWWESGRTLQPVKEAFWKSEEWRKKNLRYYPYYGRGLVQLTWEANYRKASDLVGVDLVANPDRAMDPAISVKILFDGMHRGWFTGKKLSDYIDNVDESDDEDLREFTNARRIVNGTDRQVEIGKLALIFEDALKVAGYGSARPVPSPKPVVPVKPSKDSIIGGGGAIAAGGGAAAAAAQGAPWWIVGLLVMVALAAVAFILIRKRGKLDDDKTNQRDRGNKRN